MSAVTARGHRVRGGGYVSHISPPPVVRGSTNQLCGLYPFLGSSGPNVGVPLGPGIYSHDTICGDPISWFTIAKLMSNPSWFFLGLPGLGKSRLACRIILGLAPTAVPLILGDLKPDYVDLIRALDGQILPLGRGRGSLNILDPGQMDDAAARMGGRAGSVLREEGHGRRLGILRALLAVVRGRPTDDWEDTILNAALRLLSKRWKRRTKTAPVLRDLIALIREMPDEIRLVTLDRGNDDRYWEAVDPLLRSLYALNEGPLGDMFARPTTQRLTLDRPACIDISHIAASDLQLQACALLAGWNEGFSAVEARNALADEGLEPQGNFLIVCDELWRPLRSGAGLIDRVDELTRLNRTYGVGQILITHSLADMRAVKDQDDREKARGFVERAGGVVLFGLPPQELKDLEGILRLTQQEKDLLTSWSAPAGWNSAVTATAPPGQGKFLLKVGELAGIPVHLAPVPAEAGLHNTSKRWGDSGRAHDSLEIARTP